MILSAVLGLRALASNLNQSECFFPELATLGFSRSRQHMENRGRSYDAIAVIVRCLGHMKSEHAFVEAAIDNDCGLHQLSLVCSQPPTVVPLNVRNHPLGTQASADPVMFHQ